MNTEYKLIHDESYPEERSGNKYLVVKIFNDSEIGQLKLELVNDDSHDGPTVKFSLSGDTDKIKLVTSN